VQVKRLISRRIRKAGSRIDLVADVNAVVSVNVNENGNRQEQSETRTTSSSSRAGDAGGPDNRGRKNT
jgi:hypothetical protein